MISSLFSLSLLIYYNNYYDVIILSTYLDLHYIIFIAYNILTNYSSNYWYVISCIIECQ